jgi:hypothetical protein
MNVAIENRSSRNNNDPEAVQIVGAFSVAPGCTTGGYLRGPSGLPEDDRLQHVSQESFGSIAFHGAADLPAGDHRLRIVFGGKQVQDTRPSHELPAFVEYLTKVLTARERSRDHCVAPWFFQSGRQTLAALSAAPLQNQTAGLGRAPLAEAVSAGALDVAGLKSPLHGPSSCRSRWSGIVRNIPNARNWNSIREPI